MRKLQVCKGSLKARRIGSNGSLKVRESCWRGVRLIDTETESAAMQLALVADPILKELLTFQVG